MSQGFASGATNHGALSGLTNDDHSQYLNSSRHAGEHEYATVTGAGDQTLSSSSLTAITWDTDVSDNSDWHDTGSNTDRITVDEDGFYRIDAQIRFASDATGRRQVALQLNGATTLANEIVTPVSGAATITRISTSRALSANDYVIVQALQNSGGNLDVNKDGVDESHFTVTRLYSGTPDGTGGESTLAGLGDTDITAAAKGDLLVHDGTDWVDLTVGSNDQVLTADSAETAGVKWASASGGGGASWSAILDTKTTADDPPDDEFDDTTGMSGSTNGLDAKWTAVSGSSGTVSLLSTTNQAIYDLASRDGWLMAQAGINGSQVVSLRQDWTIGTNESVIAAVAIAGTYDANNATGLADGQHAIRLALNTNDTSSTSGSYVYMDAQYYQYGSRFSVFDGTTNYISAEYNSSYRIQHLPAGQLFYMRLVYDGTSVFSQYSIDGSAWVNVGIGLALASPTNLWLEFRNDAAHSGPAPIMGSYYVRQGGAGLDPWS